MFGCHECDLAVSVVVNTEVVSLDREHCVDAFSELDSFVELRPSRRCLADLVVFAVRQVLDIF